MTDPSAALDQWKVFVIAFGAFTLLLLVAYLVFDWLCRWADRRRERKAKSIAIAQGSCPHTRRMTHCQIESPKTLINGDPTVVLYEVFCKDCDIPIRCYSGKMVLTWVDPTKVDVKELLTPKAPA